MMMLGAWLCLLGACSGSTPVEVPPPPAALVAPCAEPTRLPVRALTQAEVERLWGGDRGRLRDCAARHDALVAWADGVAGR